MAKRNRAQRRASQPLVQEVVAATGGGGGVGGGSKLAVADVDLVKATVAQTLDLMGVRLPAGSRAAAVDQRNINLRAYGMDSDQSTQFGPGAPPPETPMSTSPEPTTYQYRTGWNYPSLPGEGRPLDYQTMRDLSNVYDMLRKGIEIRKDEITSLSFDVVAREPDKRKAKQIVADREDSINRIKDFFAYPDRRNTYQAWMRALLEEYFVTDSLALWKWKDYGGDPVGYRVLDGTLVKPLIDLNGNRPLPPNPTYQQYVYGVPRWRFTSDEMMWCPKNTRVYTPYGFSPVEQFVLHINGALRFERWSVDYFTDGTIPEGVAEAPASWTKAQIQEFNSYWDSMMSGDTRALRKLKFVAAGFKFHQLKPFEFNMEFAHWLISMTAAAVDVTPSELGFEPLRGGIGGRGFGEEQASVLRRKSTKPLLKWLADCVFNPIIWHDFHEPSLMASFHEEGEEEDEAARAKSIDMAIRNGSLSIDEVIQEAGGEPVGIGRIFVFGNQVLGEPDLIAISKYGAHAVQPMGNPNPVNGGNQSSNIEQNPAPEEQGEDQIIAPDNSEEELSRPLFNPPMPDEYAAKAAAFDESSKFMRFYRARQRENTWRDFKSGILPPGLVESLNEAGRSRLDENSIKRLLATV